MDNLHISKQLKYSITGALIKKTTTDTVTHPSTLYKALTHFFWYCALVLLFWTQTLLRTTVTLNYQQLCCLYKQQCLQYDLHENIDTLNSFN